MNTEYPLADLCAALDVTRSGYHAWASRRPGPRAQADAALLPLIHQAHQEGRRAYGSPRVVQWLHDHGHRCGRMRIARLMRLSGLSVRPRRRYRPLSLTDSEHDLPVAPNRLLHQPVPAQRDQQWLADITYVPTLEGWLYVAALVDRCSRRCVGWAMGEDLTTALPLGALDMALAHRRPTAGLVHHSDRGTQYASAAYRARLAAAGVVPSMSRRGNCYDNAMIESFWSTLKRELVHRCLFATRAQARAILFEWIEVFYNRTRFHSALGYQSPVDFEMQLN